MMSRCLMCSVTLLAIVACGRTADATILTFDIFDVEYSSSEDFPEGFSINQEYGDRVTGPMATATNGTTDFFYGEAGEGYTPNVTAHYGPTSIFTGDPSLWRYDYGDLTRVLYQGSTAQPIGTNYDYLDIRLTADPGYEVVLYGFDLGGWFQADYTINEVAVFDGGASLDPMAPRLYSDPMALVAGVGPAHTTYSFATQLRGNSLSLLIDARNLGDFSELIAIDNIRFGQELAPAAIPEPMTATLFSLGLLGLMGSNGGKRRRRHSMN